MEDLNLAMMENTEFEEKVDIDDLVFPSKPINWSEIEIKDIKQEPLEEEEQLSKPTSRGLFTCSQVLLTLWEQFNTTTASTAVTRLWGLSSLATKDILKSLSELSLDQRKRPFKKTLSTHNTFYKTENIFKLNETDGYLFYWTENVNTMKPKK